MSRKSSNTSTYLAKEGKATLSGIDSVIKKLSKEREKNAKDYKKAIDIHNNTVNLLNSKKSKKPGDQLPYWQAEMYTNQVEQLKPEIKTLEGNHANYNKRIKQLDNLKKHWKSLSGGKKKTRKNVSKKRKNVSKKRKNSSLKYKINNYILKKSDICCEEDLDRSVVIEKIFKSYEKVAEFFGEKDDYLSYITNDIPKFIGYKIDLQKIKDKKGVALWDLLYNSTLKNKEANKNKITDLLNKVPLYFLLSLLGYSYCKLPDNHE